MPGTNVVGGPPSVQDTIRTMNQSIGQVMNFVQTQKALDEQKREFDIGKGLSALELMANQAGGYNVLAKNMGDALPQMLQSFGMDSLQAQGFSEGLANIQFTPNQVTMETIKKVYAGGPGTPEWQKLFVSGEFGGDTSAPDVTTGVNPVARKAIGLAGDFLDGAVGGAEGIGSNVEGDQGTVSPVVTTEVTPPPPVDNTDEINSLKPGYDELIRKANDPNNRDDVLKADYLRRANEIKDQIETLGGTVGEAKGEIKPTPKLGGQGQVTGLSSGKGLDVKANEKYNLNSSMSSFESSYTSKFANTPLPGTFPEGIYQDKNPDALNGGIPVTQEEFNQIENPSPRDSANLRLAEEFKTGAIPEAKRNSILNLMDSTYEPSIMEGANLLKNYDEKLINYQAQVRRGQAPPIPLGAKAEMQAVHKVAEASVNENLNTLTERDKILTAQSLKKNLLTPGGNSTLMENVDLIISISKQPALATYFMPEVEANRIQNRQLNLEEARLIANKEITQTNQLMGILNFIKANAASQATGNEAEMLAYKAAEKMYFAIQTNPDLNAEQKAEATGNNVLASSIEEIYGTLFSEAVGRPAGLTDVQYRNKLSAFFARILPGGNSGSGTVETFTFTPQEPIAPANFQNTGNADLNLLK